MMWMTIFRPVVVLIGVVSVAAAAVMAQIIPHQNGATTVLMILVFLLIGLELVIGVGAIVIGPEARRLALDRPASRTFEVTACAAHARDLGASAKLRRWIAADADPLTSSTSSATAGC